MSSSISSSTSLGGAEQELDQLSTLQLVDRISHRSVMEAPISQELLTLRHRVSEMEELQDQARIAVEKLGEAVDKLRAPALRLGTLIQKLPHLRALVCVGGTDYVCSVDPALPEAALETGGRVLLKRKNEACNVIWNFCPREVVFNEMIRRVSNVEVNVDVMKQLMVVSAVLFRSIGNQDMFIVLCS